MSAGSQPPESPLQRLVRGVALALLLMLLALGVIYTAGAAYNVWFPPSPVNPDDPDDDYTPVDPDELSTAAEHALRKIESVALRCQHMDRQEVHRRIWDVVENEAYNDINHALNDLDYRQFPKAATSISVGFRRVADRTRDGPTADYGKSLSKNFSVASRSAAAGDEEADVHDALQEANQSAKERLITAIASNRGEGYGAFSGYRIDEEDRALLERTSTPLPMKSANFFYKEPEEIDPRGWHKIENQGNMGSCQGHALSSVCEFSYYVGTKKVTQFSPLFAYYDSQKQDGIFGRDIGSTLAGGMKSAEQNGSCPLRVMPYPNPVRYTGQMAPGCYEAAKPFKIRRHTFCRNYDDCFRFIASGQGGVEIGILWPQDWMQCHGVLESYRPGYGGGGHAVCFLGYSSRKDSSGRKYLWLANSWGTEWGNQGWAEVAPQAVEQMCQHSDTAMIGLSDMAVAKPRDVSWIGGGAVFQPPAKTAAVKVKTTLAI